MEPNTRPTRSAAAHFAPTSVLWDVASSIELVDDFELDITTLTEEDAYRISDCVSTLGEVA